MKLRLIALLASAVSLFIVSVLGVTRAARATAAYALYHNSRYGSGKESVSGILAGCAIAYRYYPYNYYFPILAAESAYYSAPAAVAEEKRRLLGAADYWCDTGLQLNPYKIKLRLLRARIIADENPSDAVEYWQAYVDWHYWEPFNHCVLAELQAQAGDFDEAFRTLDTIKGQNYYEEGLSRVDAYWRKEMVMPEL